MHRLEQSGQPYRHDEGVTSSQKRPLWAIKRLHTHITTLRFYHGPRADAILEGTFLTPSSGEVARVWPNGATHQSGPPTAQDMACNDETDSTDNSPHTPQHLQHTNIPELVQKLLDNFQYVTKPDIIPVELTPEEYKGKLKAWDESTSTSPTSHMHLGHLRAYWAEHTLHAGPLAEALEENRGRILEGHLLLINYALQTGYSYEPWRRIVNTMLEKDPGIPKIHRLRVIHLYKANFNLILGVKWHQVLHHAVTYNLINEGCYGSQPGKEGTDALYFRKLEYKISGIDQENISPL